MDITDVISKLVDEELDDARKYMNLALQCKEEEPDVADLFAKLAGEEMNHMRMLHQVVSDLVEEQDDEDETAKGEARP